MAGEPDQNKRRNWEEIEHDADIGLRAVGETLPELFRNAADGMIALMLDPATVRPDHRRTVAAEGPDNEGLLVGWLEEILNLFECESFAPRRMASVKIDGNRITGDVEGEDFDPERHETEHGIKAVTWHNLKIQHENGLLRVEIIFDV